jgi:hypothetical protein
VRPPARLREWWAAHGQDPRHTPLLDMSWMECQYSRAGPVSSEKHLGTPGTEVKGEVATPRARTAMAVMGSSWTRPERLAVSSRVPKLTTSQRGMTLWRWYASDTRLE